MYEKFRKQWKELKKNGPGKKPILQRKAKQMNKANIKMTKAQLLKELGKLMDEDIDKLKQIIDLEKTVDTILVRQANHEWDMKIADKEIKEKKEQIESLERCLTQIHKKAEHFIPSDAENIFYVGIYYSLTGFIEAIYKTANIETDHINGMTWEISYDKPNRSIKASVKDGCN